MNSKKFFNQDISQSTSFDYDLNQLILNQLTIYAIEDDEKKFDKLLPKAQNLLSPYSIVDTYELSTDSRDGSITSASIERGENPDYSTYLHFAAYCLQDKYATKIAQIAITHSKEDYNRYMPINKDNYLIQACIINKKFEAFDFLLKSNFLTQEKVYDCLFFYKHKEMFKEGMHLFQSDLDSIFKTWDRNANNNLRQPASSKNICLAFVNRELPRPKGRGFFFI